MDYFLLKQDKRADRRTEDLDYLENRKMMESEHFVSEKLKSVFEFYEPHICFLLKNTEGKQYWHIGLAPLTDVILKDFDKAEEMILKEKQIGNRSIMLIRYQKRDYLIVNLNVAESMLRRYMTGIRYIKIITSGGE